VSDSTGDRKYTQVTDRHDAAQRMNGALGMSHAQTKQRRHDAVDFLIRAQFRSEQDHHARELMAHTGPCATVEGFGVSIRRS
jgi:hypothetical protein